jgi:hypothetical protein
MARQPQSPYYNPQGSQVFNEEPQPQQGGSQGGFPGYEDLNVFKTWYGNQQGGARPEDMNRFTRVDMNEGPGGIESGDTLKRWDPYLIKEGANAGKYKSMRGAEGFYDKPTECPEGYSPGGPNESDGCVPNGSGGGAGGSGGGRGGPGGGGGWNGSGSGDADLMMYRLKKESLDALNDKTGQKGFELLAGQGGVAQFQQQLDQLRQQANGMPAGSPQRQALENQIRDAQLNTGNQMNMAGRGAAMQLGGQVMNPEIAWNTSNRDRDLQGALGFAGLDLQRELGRGQLALGNRGASLAEQQFGWNTTTGFDWDKNQFGQTMDYNRWRDNLNSKDSRYAADKGAQAAKYQAIGSATGSLLGAIPWSDIRVKENIAPGRRGLADLVKLGVYSYNYKPFLDPSRRATMGLMAQDLEKVAPELVVESEQGIKAVDSYGLLAMTINAVKELEARTKKERK